MTPPDLVAAFLRAFGQTLPAVPTIPLPPTIDLRVTLLREEVAELLEAVEAGDRVEVAHEAADVVVVAYGAALTCGLPTDDWPREGDLFVRFPAEVDAFARAARFGDLVGVQVALQRIVVEAYDVAAGWRVPPDVLDAVVEAIMAANMRKLGPDGRPILRADGKVTKPDGWVGADISAVLGRAGVPA